jgi:hypothetical protein
MLICKAVEIALGYCKKAALRFCESLAHDATKVIFKPLLAPLGRFVGIMLAVTVYSAALVALIVFTSAIPRRS